MSAHTFGGGAAAAFSGPGSRRRHVRISRIFAISAPAANNGFVSLFPPKSSLLSNHLSAALKSNSTGGV